MIQLHKQWRQREKDKHSQKQCNASDPGQTQAVISGKIILLCSVTLSANGTGHSVERTGGRMVKVEHGVGHGMGCQGGSGQLGEIDLYQQHTALHQEGFQRHGHAQCKDLLCGRPAETEKITDPNSILIMHFQKPDQSQEHTNASRYDIAQSGTANTKVQSVDKEHTEYQMPDIDDDGQKQA